MLKVKLGQCDIILMIRVQMNTVRTYCKSSNASWSILPMLL